MSSWSLEYTIDVDLENAVVYAKIYGRWRAETAESYHAALKKEAQPLMGRPWAKVIDLTNWKTSRQEVTEVIGKHMAWSVENGVGLQIYVINNTSTYRQLNEMFDKGDAREVSQTFRTMAEAEQYLKENWIEPGKGRKATE